MASRQREPGCGQVNRACRQHRAELPGRGLLELDAHLAVGDDRLRNAEERGCSPGHLAHHEARLEPVTPATIAHGAAGGIERDDLGEREGAVAGVDLARHKQHRTGRRGGRQSRGAGDPRLEAQRPAGDECLLHQFTGRRHREGQQNAARVRDTARVLQGADGINVGAERTLLARPAALVRDEEKLDQPVVRARRTRCARGARRGQVQARSQGRIRLVDEAATDHGAVAGAQRQRPRLAGAEYAQIHDAEPVRRTFRHDGQGVPDPHQALASDCVAGEARLDVDGEGFVALFNRINEQRDTHRDLRRAHGHLDHLVAPHEIEPAAGRFVRREKAHGERSGCRLAEPDVDQRLAIRFPNRRRRHGDPVQRGVGLGLPAAGAGIRQAAQDLDVGEGQQRQVVAAEHDGLVVKPIGRKAVQGPKSKDGVCSAGGRREILHDGVEAARVELIRVIQRADHRRRQQQQLQVGIGNGRTGVDRGVVQRAGVGPGGEAEARVDQVAAAAQQEIRVVAEAVRLGEDPRGFQRCGDIDVALERAGTIPHVHHGKQGLVELDRAPVELTAEAALRLQQHEFRGLQVYQVPLSASRDRGGDGLAQFAPRSEPCGRHGELTEPSLLHRAR